MICKHGLKEDWCSICREFKEAEDKMKKDIGIEVAEEVDNDGEEISGN